MSDTSIQWTDKTWNPVRGCSVISPGCVNCYAMKQAHRFSGKGRAYEGLTKQTKAGPQWTGKVMLVEDHLADPLKWRKPARVFVNSMSDLFHESVPDEWIDRIFVVMALCPQHTFQILTKRAERMRDYVNGNRSQRDRWINTFRVSKHQMVSSEIGPFPLPNVWLGVSVENQKYADERIPLLLQTPAAVRFISAEPLLGPVDLSGLRGGTYDAMTGCGDRERLTEWEDTPSLDWVIVGGESGNGARPCYTEWIAGVVRQCAFARVPCFVKQLGSNGYQLPGGYPLRDRKGGDIDEWPADLRVREFPAQGD